jgi:serine phosphatase RsbU (regulator of sigma subunit)/pSer/pThr/pTyr-binding forkhead associated (FHA) protein
MGQFAVLNVQPLHGDAFSVLLRKDVTTIGRSWQNDLALADPWLSRRHAEIRRDGNAYYLYDLLSRNGTLVNGVRVAKRVLLYDGDKITLGDQMLTFVAQPPDLVFLEEDVSGEARRTVMVPSQQILAAAGNSEGSTWDCFDELQQTIQRQAAVPDSPGMFKEAAMVRALSEASMAAVSERTLPELLDFILDLVFKVVPAERGFLMLTADDPSQLEIKAVRVTAPRRESDREISFSRSIADKVLREQVSVLTSNAMNDPRIPLTDSIATLRIRSAMCVPLWNNERVTGLLYVDSLDREAAFGEADLQLLTALGNVAAVRIDNARLLEQMVDKKRTEHELALAAEIQRNLLPREAPRLSGWDVAGTSRPCYTIGGDYYDFVWRPGGKLAFALGDVSGKGAGAALMMTVLRATVRTYAEQEASVVSIVERTNRVMCQNTPQHAFVTLFLGELDPESAELYYVNAGHLPPLLYRPQTDGLMQLQEGGTVLGLFDTPSFGLGRVTLEPGDVLVVFTDGVSESWDDDGNEFGEMRLSDVIRRYAAFGSRELIEAIQSAVDEYSGNAHPTDDRTLIVVKRLEA